MQDIRIDVPRLLKEEFVFPFKETLDSQKDASSTVTLDFTKLSFSYPFGMLLLASQIRDFADYRRARDTKTKADSISETNPVCSYLGHIGFFQHIGLRTVGNAPGQAGGSTNYMPITELTRQELDADAALLNKSLGEAVARRSAKLAPVLTQSYKPQFNEPVAYCFREIIRNVFEHATVDKCVLCAQRWRNGIVEIGIIDRGRGIRRSLEEKYSFGSDYEALEKAVAPGVTRASGNDPGPWGNTGYGLHVLSEICRETGEFVLASGSSALLIANRQNNEWDKLFEGTAIKLRMNKPKKDFGEMMREIIDAGEKVAGSSGEVPKASKSSRTTSSADIPF
ncbi:MAG: hypothetical protein QGG42_04455 [Phycisphaerae bacterium]|jgi:hypothetical protein|nr:hypothetical protein [Phycisphaerae bacterium]